MGFIQYDGRQYIDHLTIDQQLKVAEVAALLAIAQEISAFNPQNTTVMVDGEKKNGWGFPAAKVVPTHQRPLELAWSSRGFVVLQEASVRRLPTAPAMGLMTNRSPV